MSTPLVRGRRTLEGRFRKLEQELNDELGFRDQRLRFATVQTRQGPITWRLRNQRNGIVGVQTPDGAVAELALATNDDSILYFGYNEQWEPYGRDQFQFASSNLCFAIAGADGVPELRFRLEWAGGTWFPSSLALSVAETEVIEVTLEPGTEDIELGEVSDIKLNPVTDTLSAALAGFHRLHLPARAMWHEILCEMPELASPQRHTPGSEEEIDRWLVSALRYLAHEFSVYL